MVLKFSSQVLLSQQQSDFLFSVHTSTNDRTPTSTLTPPQKKGNILIAMIEKFRKRCFWGYNILDVFCSKWVPFLASMWKQDGCLSCIPFSLYLETATSPGSFRHSSYILAISMEKSLLFSGRVLIEMLLMESYYSCQTLLTLLPLPKEYHDLIDLGGVRWALCTWE